MQSSVLILIFIFLSCIPWLWMINFINEKIISHFIEENLSAIPKNEKYSKFGNSSNIRKDLCFEKNSEFIIHHSPLFIPIHYSPFITIGGKLENFKNCDL